MGYMETMDNPLVTTKEKIVVQSL